MIAHFPLRVSISHTFSQIEAHVRVLFFFVARPNLLASCQVTPFSLQTTVFCIDVESSSPRNLVSQLVSSLSNQRVLILHTFVIPPRNLDNKIAGLLLTHSALFSEYKTVGGAANEANLEKRAAFD